MGKQPSHKVLKFGGSSVADASGLKNVAQIIIQQHTQQLPVVAIVSAFQGITDQLIGLARHAANGREDYFASQKNLEQRHINCLQELLPAAARSNALANIKVWLNELDELLQGINKVGECSERALDLVMSFGERLSAYSLSVYLQAQQQEARYCDARDFIRCDSSWGQGRVNFPETNQLIQTYFTNFSGISVVTGFIASTPDNDTITLGRGGSDYTCSIVGAALQCDSIQIWTDVDGVMTADPRKVHKAFSIPELSYSEIMELAHFGAKVVYPPTIQPALDAGLNINIKNTFNPTHPGSVIKETCAQQQHMIAGISSISKIALLRLEGSGMIGIAGTAMRLFAALAREQISIILITQASSEHTICVAVLPDFALQAKNAIEREFQLEIAQRLIDPVLVEEDLSIVSVVGENMRHTPGISARVFSALGSNAINVKAIAQGSSELNISVVIDRVNEAKALNALHDAFFLSENKTLNLFMVGTGLIASTLLKQIARRSQHLINDLNLEVALRGISNSRHCLLAESGAPDLSLSNYEAALSATTPKPINEFVNAIIAANLPNSVFVDCSASEVVTGEYLKLLNHSIAVVTPNKKAQAGAYNNYQQLRRTARKRSTHFLYETSVGAGLPIINTLNDLIKSGDEIIKIEAVLSGTLSFIFNNYDGSHPFSAVVKKAQELGYTEPDPRDDLCGLDFGRKLLILAREAGFACEQEQVKVQNLVPENCRSTKSIAEFYEKLQEADQYFADLAKNAHTKQHKLCYLGSISPTTIEVSLQSVPADHPCYSLSGSDNIVLFTTTRYSDRPLVVKGPGAGAEVTAAGVFADIIRVGLAK